MITDPAIPSVKLPPGKNDVIEVFADFYSYMYERARNYIKETHGNGDLLWESFGDDIDFILSHPNGWEGAQQGAMRKAALKAGLVPDTLEGRERIRFVTEGEASFHFCISNGMISDSVKVSQNSTDTSDLPTDLKVRPAITSWSLMWEVEQWISAHIPS